MAALHYERVEVWDETGLVIARDTPIVRASVDIVVTPSAGETADSQLALAEKSEIKALRHHARAKEVRVISQVVEDEYARKLLTAIAEEYDDMAATFEQLAASHQKLGASQAMGAGARSDHAAGF